MFRHVVTAGVRHENGDRGVLCACNIPILFDARAPGAIVCLDEDGHRPRPPRATSVAVDDDDDAADDDARATATASLCRLCISRSTGPMAGGADEEEGSGVGDDIRAI